MKRYIKVTVEKASVETIRETRKNGITDMYVCMYECIGGILADNGRYIYKTSFDRQTSCCDKEEWQREKK